MENNYEIVNSNQESTIEIYENDDFMQMIKEIGWDRTIGEKIREIGWETFKETFVKKIPIFGDAFTVADNIKASKQIDSLMKGIEYIWYNYNVLTTNLNDKIDKNFANESNAEFVSLVYSVVEKITKQHKEEKIKLLSNFITNVVTKDNSSCFNKEMILEKISYYAIEHIYVLRHIYELEILDGKKNENERSKLKNSNVNIKNINNSNIDEYTFRVCMRDLKSDGFIDEITGAYFDYEGGNYYITDFGMKCILLLQDIQ